MKPLKQILFLLIDRFWKFLWKVVILIKRGGKCQKKKRTKKNSGALRILNMNVIVLSQFLQKIQSLQVLRGKLIQVLRKSQPLLLSSCKYKYCCNYKYIYRVNYYIKTSPSVLDTHFTFYVLLPINAQGNLQLEKGKENVKWMGRDITKKCQPMR